MEQSSQKKGLVNLLLLLAATPAAYVAARLCHSAAGLMATVFLGLGFLVALVSWFQMRLEDRERLERFELDELARSKGSATLFANKDEETFPARQSRILFEKFFVPGFTIVLLFLEAAAAWWLWIKLPEMSLVALQNQELALGAFGLFFLVLFLFGKYAAGIARLDQQRLLGPGAGWVLLGAYLCFLTLTGIVASIPAVGFLKVDGYLARIFCGFLGLLALETLISLIFEIYRPRVKGKVGRPLYESRLVGLMSHPEGLFTTAAKTLDYQFGFKISETWAYQMLAEKLPLFGVGLVVAALLSSCFVFLDPGEQAFLERFGHLVNGDHPMGPGVHLKLPWPVDHVYRYNTEEIQSFNIGYVEDTNRAPEKTMVWTVPHYKEEYNMLVASIDQQSLGTADASGAATESRQSAPVNLLAVGIPVQYHISNARDWAYGHADAPALLEQVATREVVRYLVGVDLLDIMSSGREQAADELRRRIQARADELKLGVQIMFVGVEGIHPPVPVAASFEAVNGAEQTAQAVIWRAQGMTNATVLAAQATALEQVRTATGKADRQTRSAAAQALLFTNQIVSYLAAPDVYPSRVYYKTVIPAIADARKYIIGPTNTHEVYQLNLEDKTPYDWGRVNVPTVEPPKK